MEDSKVDITIKHRAPGIHPPLYVAGSFSDPQWVPQLMDCTTGEDGVNIFSKTVQVEPRQKYQYKFRVGEGDWWILDETAATVTDDSGHRNNLIEAPEPTESPKVAIEAPEATDVTSLEETTEAVDPSSIDQITEEQNDACHKEPPYEADMENEKSHPQTHLGVLDSSLTERQATSTPDFVRTTIEVADTAAELDRSDAESDENNESSQFESETLDDSVEQHSADEAVPTDDTKPLSHQEPLAQADKTPSPTETAQEATAVSMEPVDTKQVSDDIGTMTNFETGFHSNNAAPEIIFSNDDALDIAGYTGGPEPVPLFAHECAGIYEDDEIPAATSNSDDGNSSSAEHGRGTQDFDDPTLEQFPSSRDAIISTVRKVSTSLSADETSIERPHLSPVVGPQNDLIEHIGDREAELASSPQQASFLLPRNQSYKSLGEASQSLQSIAEGAEEDEQGEGSEKPENETVSQERFAQEESETASIDATDEGGAQIENRKTDDIASAATQTDTLDEIIHTPQDTENSQAREVASVVDQAPSPAHTSSSTNENTGFTDEQLSPLSKSLQSGAEDTPVIQEIPAVEEDLSSQGAARTQQYLDAGHAVAPEDQELSPLSKPISTNVEEVPSIEPNLAIEEVLPTPDISTSGESGVALDQELSPTSKPVRDDTDEIPAIQGISPADHVPAAAEPTTIQDNTEHDVNSSIDRVPATIAAATSEEAQTVEDVPTFEELHNEELRVNEEADVHGEGITGDNVSAAGDISNVDKVSASEEVVVTEQTPAVGEFEGHSVTTTGNQDHSAGEVVSPAEGHDAVEDSAKQATFVHNEAPGTDKGSFTESSATIEETFAPETFSRVAEDYTPVEQTDGAYERSDEDGNAMTREISTTEQSPIPLQDALTVEDASAALDKTDSAPTEADFTDSSANSSKEADEEHSQATVAKESVPTTEEADSQDEGISLSKDDQDTLSPPKHDLQAVITVPSPSTKPDTDLLSPISAEDEGVVLRPHSGEDKSVGAIQPGQPSVEDIITTEPEAPGSTERTPQPNVTDDTIGYDLDGEQSKPDVTPSVTSPFSPEVAVSTARDISFQEDVLSAVPLGEGNTKHVERPSGVESFKDDELPKSTEPANSETRPKDEADNVEAVSHAYLRDDSHNVEPIKEDVSPQSAEAYKATQASETAGTNESKSIEIPFVHEHDSEDRTSEVVASSSAAEPAPSGSLTKRAAARSVPIDRTGTPTSITDSHKEAAKGGNWFSAFFRLIFIDLFGGLVSRLCGGRRKTLVTAGVALTAVFLIAYRRTKEPQGELVI